MSEHLAHVALFDDVRRLALDDGLLPDALERCLREHHREGRFGTISSKNHRFMLPMAEDYDDAALADDESARRRMAYVLGWAVHRAADRYFKLGIEADSSSHRGREGSRRSLPRATNY